MRHLSRAALALAIPLLAACGTASNLLSAGQAGTLRGELDTASSDLTSGDCVAANRQIQQVQTQVAQLPGSVDPTLVGDLSRGAATVLTLAKSQCSGAVGAGSDTTTTASTTTTTPRTSTVPTTTVTTPTTTTSTTPTSTTTTPSTTTTTPSTPATTTPAPGTGTTGTNGGATLPGSAGAGPGQNSQ